MIEALDERAERVEIGILLVGIQRDAVIMRQRGKFIANPGQALRIMRRIAVEYTWRRRAEELLAYLPRTISSDSV